MKKEVEAGVSQGLQEYKDDAAMGLGATTGLIATMTVLFYGKEGAEEIALKIAFLLGVPADKVDLVDLQVASNALLYKAISDHIPLYVSDLERFKRWISASYVRVLDEEESLIETYFVRLEKKLRQHVLQS